MKQFSLIMLALATVCLTDMSHTSAEDDQPKIETSKAFNKLKHLIGDWEGKLEKSTGEVVDLKLSYKLISNDSVILESSVEGGVEMLTTYKDRFGKLTATHYCALGNQPTFNLSTMTGTTLDFDFDPLCGLKEGKHKFVKDWKITHDLRNPGVLVTEYLLINEDETTETSKASLKRIKN